MYNAYVYIEIPEAKTTAETKEKLLDGFNISRQISENVYEDIIGNLIYIEKSDDDDETN